MPVWNGEQYLREAVDSLLAQRFGDFELVVVDDGSTDSSPSILTSYRDPRLRVIRLEHSGLVRVLNVGVAQAGAEWVARQDADDISHPLRLEKQWRAVRRVPNVVLSYTNVQMMEGIRLGRVDGHFPRSRALLAMKLCWQNPFTHSSVLFRKTAFETVRGYDPQDRHGEDYSLWGRLLEVGDVASLAEPLLTYRVHPTSDSRKNPTLLQQYTTEIALRHCRRFMQLSDEEAKRAFRILCIPRSERPWSEWLWFLRYCAPRLRWKSAELYAWLGAQTLAALSANGGR